VSRWTFILTARPGASVDHWLSAANSTAAPGVASSVAARAADDRKGLGELIWALRLVEDARPADIAAVAALLDLDGPVRVVDEVVIEPLASRVVPMAGPRVLRTLLIRVRPDTPAGQIAGLESAIVAMPDYIDTIRSWSLSRLDPARHEFGWTHLWEQEFVQAAGFRPYMAHPVHWTGIERWFDPEIPGYIVEDEAHYLSPSPAAILID
jgi:hypothetical protein